MSMQADLIVSDKLISTTNPLPSSASGSYASDGVFLNLDSLSQSFVYNTDGTLNYLQVVQGGNTYRQTFTYTSGQLTGFSNWVKQ